VKGDPKPDHAIDALRALRSLWMVLGGGILAMIG
jgi:hypothetical protein